MKPIDILRSLPALSALLAAAAWPNIARAGTSFELPSVLVISKSSNRNQVHYALQVDDACEPVRPAPLRPYWRMLERAPNATEPLLGREQRVLGVAGQDVGDDTVRFVLRGIPGRTITVHTFRAKDGSCTSSATMSIAGVNARLADVFVKQKLFGVDYVQLTGWSADGSAVREKVAP